MALNFGRYFISCNDYTRNYVTHGVRSAKNPVPVSNTFYFTIQQNYLLVSWSLEPEPGRGLNYGTSENLRRVIVVQRKLRYIKT